MKDKSGLVYGIQQSIRGKLHNLEEFIAQQLSESEKQATERAHLATCGDRPFVGCNPCQPDDVTTPAKPATNPTAASRPGPRKAT